MVVWGGSDASAFFDDTWSLTPGGTKIVYLRP
jgi:hypothetical protein